MAGSSHSEACKVEASEVPSHHSRKEVMLGSRGYLGLGQLEMAEFGNPEWSPERTIFTPVGNAAVWESGSPPVPGGELRSHYLCRAKNLNFVHQTHYSDHT
jgi:hypothetical protein